MDSTVSNISQKEKLSKLHLDFLSKKSRKILCDKLNNKKCIRSEKCYSRDWRGKLYFLIF